jgi:hypothetical protein
MNLRKKMFKYQEKQAAANKIGEGNNELFLSQFC